MLGNWVRQTTTTTGTGSLTLSSVSGYPTFNDVFGTSRRFVYTILNDSDGKPIESGIGYMSSSTVLVREKVAATYSGGTFDDTSPSAISLAAGTYRVICSASAEAVQGAGKHVLSTASFSNQRLLCSQHFTTNSASSSGYTVVADQLLFVPFYLTASADVDALAVRVGTAASGKSIRLGIYDVGSDGQPGALLAETSSLSVAGTGDNIGTITRVRLQPGWYFTACVSDGTPIIGRVNIGGETPCLLGSTPSNMLVVLSAIYGPHTFGALPSTAPGTGLNYVSTSTVPAIMVRLA